MHRDIKTDNILCASDGRVKIADLGFSDVIDIDGRSYEMQVGTTSFLPPEILNLKPYDYKVDVWSFGCFAYHLATGRLPFEHLSDITNETARIEALFESLVPPINKESDEM